MGFETTTLRDPVGCFNHWAAGDSMASKGQFVGVDRNHHAATQPSNDWHTRTH